MKKTSLAALSLVAIAAASCSQKHTIEGNISGWDNDSIIVISSNINGESAIDTIVANNGQFAYDVAPTDTVQLTIVRNNDVVESASRGQYILSANQINVLVAGSQKIAIKGQQSNDKLTYTSKGSEFEESKSKLNKERADLNAKIDMLQLQADSMISAGAPREVIMPVFEEQMGVRQQLQIVELEYAKSNPNSDYSAFVLISQPLDTIALYYPNLSESVRNGIFMKSLNQMMAQYEVKQKKMIAKEQIAVGLPAPNFTLKSLDGSDISLYDIKDKYIVLDFWGNWCGWCVKGFPEMKKCYAKYKNKLEIVGIDCGDKEEVWKAAVAKYELPWTQLINGQGDQDMTVLYAIEGFPTKIIIDPSYKIVDIAMGETEDFYHTIDKLMK